MWSQYIIKIVSFPIYHFPFMTYHYSSWISWCCGVGDIFFLSTSFIFFLKTLFCLSVLVAFNIWLGIGSFLWLWRGSPFVHVVYLLPFHRHIAFSSSKSGWWDLYRVHLMVSACVWARGWSAPKQVLHFGWTWVYFSTNPDLVKEKNCAAVIPPWLPFEYHSSYKLK